MKVRLILFLLAVSTNLAAQNKANETMLFKKLDALYVNSNINDTVYMDKLDSLTSSLIGKGVYFSIEEMAANLSQYEKVAWSNKKYGVYRQNYFLALLNNAYMSGVRGASVYYAEKVKTEAEKNGNPRSLIEMSVKSEIYSFQNRYGKIVEVFEKEKKYFDELNHKVKNNPKKTYLEALDGLQILKTTFNAYAAQNDTANVNRIYNFSKEIVQNLNKVKPSANQHLLLKDFTSLTLDFYKESFYSNYNNALNVIRKIENLHNVYPNEPTDYINYSLLNWKIGLYLEMGQADSAEFYINKYSEIPDYSKVQKLSISKYKAELALLKGNFKEAALLSKEALKQSAEIQNSLAEEMDDLLYAHTKAEHHRLAFIKSEKEKEVKNNWIKAIITIAVLLIGLVFFFIRFKDLKYKKLIKSLNESAEIQILMMDQLQIKARNEEREKISQNLHDDLAGTLAAVKNNIDVLANDSTFNDKKEQLQKISQAVESSYNAVRNKSHDLYDHSSLTDEKLFTQSILQLSNIAFPANRYSFTVTIDDFALEGITVELRAALIHVLKEAFSNIIKHTKATQIDLLFYREENNLFMNLKDNGKGHVIDTNKKTLGVTSMRKRIERFNGKLEITNSAYGVEIEIIIPIQQ